MNKLGKAVLEIHLKRAGTRTGLMLLGIALTPLLVQHELTQLQQMNLLLLLGGLYLIQIRARW